MRPWAAPTASGPVSGHVVVPGSKSASARAYVLAALGDAPSVLSGVLDARDTRLMRAALTTLGVGFDDLDRAVVRVSPPATFTAGRLDVGQAGTLMRFLPPLAALATGDSAFTGDPEAERRPVRPLLDGLAQVGVRITHPEAVPFTVHGTGGVRGGSARIDASGSSQFVSGLLLSAARFDEGLTLTHTGATLPSLPHIAMTVGMLADRGVSVEGPAPDAAAPTWRVAPGIIAARDEAIEPDLVNAAVFLAAGVATGGTVSVAWPRHTLQAGEAILGVLTDLGATLQRSDDRVAVTGGTLRGGDIDLADASELTCIVAALIALSGEPGRIRGVGHVRLHETDRLAALETELRAHGADVHQTDDGLTIEPGRLRGGPFATYADHRMAHAGAVLGLGVPGVRLDDLDCTTKTMADFGDLWQGLVGA